MVEYVLSDHFYYGDDKTTIGIGENTLVTEKVTDDEILQYVSDSITHEHVHKVLHELFGKETCKLFDIVEHTFREYPDLQDRLIKEYTWYNTFKNKTPQQKIDYLVCYYITTTNNILQIAIEQTSKRKSKKLRQIKLTY